MDYKLHKECEKNKAPENYKRLDNKIITILFGGLAVATLALGAYVVIDNIEKNNLKQRVYQISGEDTNSVEGLYHIAKDLGVNERKIKNFLEEEIENVPNTNYQMYIKFRGIDPAIKTKFNIPPETN